MIFGRHTYVPLLRTRDAELKGIENVRPSLLDLCLPVFELTRSRRTKSSPQGQIEKNLERISALLGERKYILDVTVEDEYSNNETELLLNPDDGFANWCEFIETRGDNNLIPMVHLVEGMTDRELSEEVSRLITVTDSVAVRLDYTDGGIEGVMRTICDELPDPAKLIVILDAGFIRTGSERDHDDLMINAAQSVMGVARPAAIIPMSSSFPSNVKEKGYGGDASGEFSMSEVLLSDLVVSQMPNAPIHHGDYGSIHPFRYPGMFGGWVPRIDVPLEDLYFYHRCRRDAGGYETAARRVLEDDRYESAKTWGDEQIEFAAQGEPEGRSPAHWIAVRVNIHLSRQANRGAR